jgi:Photosynthetic reaction centre cytochrome C subunit
MNSPFKKKLLVGLILSSFTLFGVLATKPPDKQKEVYTNLQVLSKNISDENMDFVMGSFNMQLGVNCLFCHVSKQKGYEFTFDFASDSLRNKRIARDMLRMTMKLNKKYFDTKLTGTMTTRGKIWCKTCHRGKPVPILKSSLK